jgi:hypothetical protein
MKVKCISVLQPWASLIVLGHKKIETRSWNTKHRGEIYIHASQSTKGLKMLDRFPYESINNHLEDIDMLGNFDFPLGAIIGKVNLVSTIPTSTVNIINCDGVNHQSGKSWKFFKQELAFGDYSPNRYGWLLDNPVAFDKPIPAKGKLSSWEYEL